MSETFEEAMQAQHARASTTARKVPRELVQMLARVLVEAIDKRHSVDQCHAKVNEVIEHFDDAQRLITWAREHPQSAAKLVRALDQNPGGMRTVYIPPIEPLPCVQCSTSSFVDTNQD